MTYKETEKQIGYILKRYYKYKKFWDEQFRKKLAEYALWDHAIDLKPGTYLRFFLMYKFIKIEN